MQITTIVLAALAGSSPLVSARALASQPQQPPRRAVTTTVGLPSPSFSIHADPAGGIAEASVQAFPVALPATECTLFWQFQAGFPVAQSLGLAPGAAAPQINVFDVDGNAPGALVGTFAIGAQDGRPHDINTFQCRDPLTVRFEIAADAGQPGSVSFQADGQNGIFLEYTH